MQTLNKPIIKWLILIVSTFSLCFIFWPVQLSMKTWGLICLIPAIIMPFYFIQRSFSIKCRRDILLYDLILLLIVSSQFIHFCRLTLALFTESVFFHIPHTLFVACFVSVLDLLALPILVLIHSAVLSLLEKYTRSVFPLYDLIRFSGKLLIISLLQFYSLQYSCHCFTVSFSAILTNIALLLFFN